MIQIENVLVTIIVHEFCLVLWQLIQIGNTLKLFMQQENHFLYSLNSCCHGVLRHLYLSPTCIGESFQYSCIFLLFHSYQQCAQLSQPNTCICWTFPVICLQGPHFKQSSRAWIIALIHLGVQVFLTSLSLLSCIQTEWQNRLLLTVILKDLSFLCQVVYLGLGFSHSVFQLPWGGSIMWSHASDLA